jgi:hypothetical protein
MRQSQYLIGAGVRGALRLAAACFCACMLTACISGPSGDVVCNQDSKTAPLIGEIKGNVVVPKNATCFMRAHIAGDVTTKEGARVYVLDGTRIDGAFRAVGASVVRFNIDEGAHLAGAKAKIVVGGNLVIKDSRLSGVSGIAATEIGGNLIIARNSDGGLQQGATMLSICAAGWCRAEAPVVVAKSVKIKQNQVAIEINNTSIGIDLKCTSNETVPVIMKPRPADLAAGQKAVTLQVKGHRSGQCERMRELVMSVPGPKVPA